MIPHKLPHHAWLQYRIIWGYSTRAQSLSHSGEVTQPHGAVTLPHVEYPQIIRYYCSSSTATTMPRVKVRQEKNTAVEEKIRCSLEKRDREGTPLQELAIEFEVPRSLLNDREESRNHGRKRMKRSRPCPQPSRVHWRSGRRRWAIMASLPGLTFSKW